MGPRAARGPPRVDKPYSTAMTLSNRDCIALSGRQVGNPPLRGPHVVIPISAGVPRSIRKVARVDHVTLPNNEIKKYLTAPGKLIYFYKTLF